MERAKRIELSSQPWQGRVLPLNHARKNLFDYLFIIANLRKLAQVCVSLCKCYFLAPLFTEASSNSCGAKLFK